MSYCRREMLSSSTCHEENNNEKRSKSSQPPLVDYGNVALYIPVAQVCFALGTAQAVVLLIPVIVQGSTCGVRTIAVAVTCASVLMSKRIRLGDAKGADALFESLRPMVCVWIVALVMEQLLRSCGKGESNVLASHHTKCTYFSTDRFHFLHVAGCFFSRIDSLSDDRWICTC